MKIRKSKQEKQQIDYYELSFDSKDLSRERTRIKKICLKESPTLSIWYILTNHVGQK